MANKLNQGENCFIVDSMPVQFVKIHAKKDSGRVVKILRPPRTKDIQLSTNNILSVISSIWSSRSRACSIVWIWQRQVCTTQIPQRCQIQWDEQLHAHWRQSISGARAANRPVHYCAHQTQNTNAGQPKKFWELSPRVRKVEKTYRNTFFAVVQPNDAQKELCKNISRGRDYIKNDGHHSPANVELWKREAY